MKKSVLEIYSLLVCFIAVVWSVIAIGSGIYDVIRITNPTFTISGFEYNKYLSDDKFIEHLGKDRPIPSEEEIKRRREEGMKIALQEEGRLGFQSLVRNLIALILNAIVFTLHWRLARRSRVLNQTA